MSSQIDTITLSENSVVEPLKKKVAIPKKVSAPGEASTTDAKKASKPRAKKNVTDVDTTPGVASVKVKKAVPKKEATTAVAVKKVKKVKATIGEKKTTKSKKGESIPVEPTSELTTEPGTLADSTTSSLRLNYNIDNKGYAYRTFKLVSVDTVPLTKEHSATQSSRKMIVEYDDKERIILCPRNAASKIFTSWSYSNNTVDVTTISHVICIKETTRKSTHRDFYYRVIREAKLNNYCVTSPDGKKKNICSKFTNRLTALKKADIKALDTMVVPITPTPVAVE